LIAVFFIKAALSGLFEQAEISVLKKKRENNIFNGGIL